VIHCDARLGCPSLPPLGIAAKGVKRGREVRLAIGRRARRHGLPDGNKIQRVELSRSRQLDSLDFVTTQGRKVLPVPITFLFLPLTFFSATPAAISAFSAPSAFHSSAPASPPSVRLVNLANIRQISARPPALRQPGRPGVNPKVDGRDEAHEAPENEPDLAPLAATRLWSIRPENRT